MNYPAVQYDVVPLKGGMDQATPTLLLPPGFVRRAANFECSITGGYSRIAGYERYDGHARPSDAVYAVIEANITGSVAVGDTVTGGTSGATGKVIVRSGSSIVITRYTGAFQDAENILVSAIVQGTVVSFLAASADGELDAQYTAEAANDYRADIQEVPGAGSILGVFYFNNSLYAWRNNASSTAAVLHKDSATGWQAVSFGEEVSFTNANVNVADGAVLTQGAVTATIARVVVETGTLLSGVNTGRLIITGRAGGSFSAGAATSTGSGSLSLSGAQSAISFLPNGRFRFSIGNFGAGPESISVYGCDGVNRAFEFDGTTLVPISTGMATDTPSHVAIHKQHLFLVFGSSLQNSSIGDPYSWSAVTGAGEIGLSEVITNLIVMPGDQTSGALGVFTKTTSNILYGTSSANFALTTLNSGSGALDDSTQSLEQIYLLNDFGVTSLASTQAFGNFAASALTMSIRQYVSERAYRISSSGINRAKGQYRVFFNEGSGLYLTIVNGKYMGAIPVEFPNPVVCMCEGRDQFGNATSYFGSSNGMVYQLDIGTSFDGEQISATLDFVFNKAGNHRIKKRYRKVSFELSGGSYIKFDVGYALGYASPEIEQGVSQSYAQFLRASYWDSFIWDSFVWDGGEVAPAELEMTGTAENVAMRVSVLSDQIKPFTINTITTHYSERRGMR